ncbi:MAG TPA: hypothetical protein VE570_08350 [Thermoleophilaceae bacterium]|nr:hypothetical protein [Thermoleophilaceae bacterium]
MSRSLRSALLATAIAFVGAAPAALADAPWSAPARVPGAAGAVYDLWFPDSGPGVLSSWCCGGFGPSVPATRLAMSTPSDSFGAWRTLSRRIAARAVAGSGSERFAFGWIPGPEGITDNGLARLTPSGLGRPFRVLPPMTVSAEIARSPGGTFALIGQISVHAKDRRERRSIYLTVHRPGHGFTRPAKLAGRGDQADLGVAVAPSGGALAVWARNGELFVRERYANGRLGATRRLTRQIGTGFPTAALAPNGAAAVAWSQAGRTAVALRPARGRFGLPRMLEGYAGAGAELAAYGDGRIQLAWLGYGDTPVVRVALARGSLLGAAQTVADADIGPVRVAIGGDGAAVITWLARGIDGSATLRAAVQPTGAAFFGPPETITEKAGCCVSFLAVDPRSDRPVVAWQPSGPLPEPAYTASRDPIRGPSRRSPRRSATQRTR